MQAKRNHPSFSFLFSVFILLVCLTAPFTWTNKIRTSELVVSNKDIPMAFDGYKIVQLSDIHADYFPKGKLLEEAVDIINKVNADLILITGDFVSYKSAELNHLMEILKRFQSTDGVYVVLGNHDYGTYYHWKNEELKENNFKELLSCFNNLDWNLLQNETVFIVKDNDSIALAGTEHYSRKESHYPSAANINLALKDVPKTMPVICMTHNPEYWADTIRYIDNYVFLTLSGHTHGMQIGIHGNAKINMYRLKNKFTAGLYKNGNRYLYINTGFGTVGFPFRIGLKPEITVVELRVM
ncbi:metallophosphoesterase [Bacteroidales bacterium OttesenSCG-928-K22]|nr:metallophosphoesterase [Bacteroidales bacterium OttesenSCG-928-K22]